MRHEEAVECWIPKNGIGVEIGPFLTPIPGIDPIYVDRFPEYAGHKCLGDYWGDACELPFLDNSLDYLVGSHLLEHVANPVLGLLEWNRVLRPGGIIYLVVPDRRYTFDRDRVLTDLQHMWNDYLQGTSQCDGTHIDDFIDRADWSMFQPDIPPAEVPGRKESLRQTYHSAIRSGGEINIHFHVFEPWSLRAFIETACRRVGLNWEILAEKERFPDQNPDGMLMVIRANKTVRDRLASWHRSRDREAVLSPSARPLHIQAADLPASR